MIDKVVEVIKKDVDGNVIEGAELKVYDEEGKMVDEWISTKESHKVNNLVENKNYILKEISAKEGYVIASDVKFTVTTDKETQTIEMIDKIVEITKKDVDGNVIEGAKLSVCDKDGNVLDEWTSTKEPHRVNNLVENKNYILKEISAKEGYVIASDIEFEVTTKKENQKIEMIDKIVEVTKKDIAGEEIEGAELKVYDEEEKLVDEWTSTKEPHKIKNLIENKSYILKEFYAKEGYVIASDIKFTVTADKQTQKLEMIDKVVEMSKKDIAGNEIEGATMIVTNKKTKNIVDKWISGKEPHKIQGLIEGESYILHEEIASDKFVKATDIEFTVTLDKETQKIEMIDKQVLISKTDLVTGEELEGAELIVTDKEGNVIDKWTSSKEPHYVSGLEEGKEYILTEITCPYGFEQAESIEFTVTTDKETQKIEMKDMPILKDIKVIKVDSETKENIKDKFTFGIYEDPECTKLIKEVKSNKEDGFVVFEDLRYNTFYIKELKSPKNYQLSDKVVKVEINDKGTFADGELLEDKDSVCEFEFYNTPIPKIQTGNEINYILLATALIISLIGIVGGVILFIRKRQ